MKQNELNSWVDRLRIEFPALKLILESDTLLIGVSEHPEILTILEEKGWELFSDEWHGHFETPQEAFETALLILSGRARTANEFRGDTRSGTWLEVFDGDFYEVRHKALYLNPFDRDEWRLWPGEKWVVKRTLRRLVEIPSLLSESPLPEFLMQLGEINEFETESEEPHTPADEWCLTRWETEIGPPAQGFRWTNDYYFKLAFQAPIGWRRELEQREECNSVTFAPPHRRVFIRIFTFFRDAEKTDDCSKESDIPLIDYSHEPICTHGPEWTLHHWTLVFPGNDQDMRADIDLYCQLGSHQEKDWFRLIDPLWSESRYVEV